MVASTKFLNGNPAAETLVLRGSACSGSEPFEAAKDCNRPTLSAAPWRIRVPKLRRSLSTSNYSTLPKVGIQAWGDVCRFCFFSGLLGWGTVIFQPTGFYSIGLLSKEFIWPSSGWPFRRSCEGSSMVFRILELKNQLF